MLDLRDLMRRAYKLAHAESTDTSTKVGAVLIDPDTNRIVSSGVNAFTDSSMALDPRNRERPRKYKLTEHAERATIYKAARLGIATDGLTMVCPWACCPDCARAIVLAGILIVYAHKQAYDKTPPRWREEVNLGIEILRRGGVKYLLYDAEIGENTVNLFDGEIWYP